MKVPQRGANVAQASYLCSDVDGLAVLDAAYPTLVCASANNSSSLTSREARLNAWVTANP